MTKRNAILCYYNWAEAVSAS